MFYRFRRQTTETDATGHAEVVRYDAAGRVEQRDKASVGGYYAYDAAGRVTGELRYPSGDRIAFQYDARGAQTGVQKTGVPNESWEYDLAGRVTHYASVQPATVSRGLPMGMNSPGFVRPAVAAGWQTRDVQDACIL